MDSDTSWYDEGQSQFKTQPSTSGSQRGRPPDVEMKEEKPNINTIEKVSLIDDEDDPEEALNSFHCLTRRKILLPLTGVEIHEELQFLEALKQFKMILEEKVEMLTLRKNLKEMLYKYLLFFATNYGRITILYKDQYLEVMEDILLFYCDVIKEFFRDQKRRNKKMKVIQEARRIKMLLRDCLLRKMDRILHVLLKVRLAPEVEEYGMLWGDVYMYFLTKVPYKHTDDDILRGFIAFQKFKTIRVKSESAMIDKLMLEIYKKSTEELRRIPCLGEIIDRMKRDRLYTVRDMVASYMRYYNEKRSQCENFQLEDVDEDTVDENVNELRHLDLTGSLLSVPTISDTGSPAAQLLTDRRKGVRKTVLDMAVEPGPQFEQYNTDFSLFGDVAKKEAPEEPVVILDDDDDDDVIVVCDNLRNVITIDDDDDDEEPVHSRPIRSPPPREALSPDRILLRPDAQLEENHAPNRVDHADTSPPEQTPIADEPEKDTLLRPPTNKDDSVPENILPKEPRIPKNMEASVPKTVQIFEAPISTRLVKKVDNSLRITINSVPYPDGGSVENVPAVESHRPKCSAPGESQPLADDKSISAGEFTESAGTNSGLNLDERPEILPTEVTCLPSTFEKDRFGTSQEKISGSDDLPPPKSTDKPENQQVDKPESQRMTPPMEIEEEGAVTAAPRTAEPLQDRSPEPKSQRNQSEENPMEIDCPSLSEAFERRGSMINSTMNDDSEPTSNDNVRPPRRDGVLPSSKIPSDLDESPEKFSRAINLSDTSNVSSPMFECIDTDEAKKYFERQRHGASSRTGTETSLSSIGTEASTSTTGTDTSNSTTGSSVTGSSVETSTSTGTGAQSILQISDDSVLDDSNITKEITVIQVENTDTNPNKTAQTEQEPSDLSSPVPIERKSKSRNYSNLTECFTKFTEELSVEDISQSEEVALCAENQALSTESDANDVIMVNCRLIEPLKDEDDIVSGPETVTFSTDEVLAPSDEPIALLVTYPGGSQEESQHFLMCDANLALIDDQLGFSGDEIASGGDLSMNDGQSDGISIDSNRNVQKESMDGLSLSGSQPYTPQSSPNTRIEAVKPDITKLDEGSSTLEPLLDYSRPAFGLHYRDSGGVIKVNNGKTAKENGTKAAKRRKSTDVSPAKASSKPRRQSSDVSNKEPSQKSSVEDFRDDLSQSLTAVTRITPQEVDKINQLPLRFSQTMWTGGDKSQPKTEVSQFGVEKPTPAKVPQKTSDHDLQRSPTDSKREASPLNPSDGDINNLTRPASFVEEKLHELYLKEYGNVLSQPDVSRQRTPGKRRDSLKIYAKEKPAKDGSQSKDRDISLKSYKALIKEVSKRRTSLSRDVKTPLPKEELIAQLPDRIIPKAYEDISQLQKDLEDSNPAAAVAGTVSQEAAGIYDHAELFNNGMEGPIEKPSGVASVDDNFFWDSDTDVGKEDAFSGTISVKPDSQLFQANKGLAALQKNLVSGLKSSKTKLENGPCEQRSPEKKKVTFASVPPPELYNESEAREKQPNYFDYSFNNLFASQTNLNLPSQQNLISPDMPGSYYPNLNYTNPVVCFNNSDKLPSSQTGLFMPPQNLEIDPNLLHSEKIVPENYGEAFIAANSQDTGGALLEPHYGFETSEEVPYLSLSNALIGGSLYSASQQSSIMFKDNPFIGQNVNIGSPNNQPGGYLYTPEIEHIASLTAPHAHTVQNTAPVPAPAKAKIVPASAKPHVAPNQGKSVSKPEPIQFPAQIYNDPALISHDNLYFDQSNLRLRDISTLKDPRRKNNKNFAQAHEMTGSNMARSVPATVDPMAQNSGFLQSYRRDVEKLPPRMATPAPEQSKMIHDSAVQATDTQKIIRKNTSLHAAPKMEESNPAETSQECLQKAQLPPKKRKLTDDEELAIYIQKFKEEKERKKKLEENISYPAQRQMSIADLQRDFPKAKTLAARKLCPEGTGGYPDQNYYEYPPGYEQYGDFNDYGNKRSIMNVYINGVRECSANYPLCLMIGTVHTCVNNANSTPEAASNNKPEHSDDAVQARPTAEVPQYAELTTPAENYQNIQKNIVSNVVARQGADVPPARPKRNRKAGASAEEAPPAKRGRGRPRKIIN